MFTSDHQETLGELALYTTFLAGGKKGKKRKGKKGGKKGEKKGHPLFFS